MRVRLVVLALLAGSGALAPVSGAFASPPGRSTPGSGSVGIRLVAVAGGLSDDPLARSYIVNRVAPGKSLTRTVQIDNDSNSTVDVSVYPAAANVVRGIFSFGPGHNANELSSWTSVSQDMLRLAPGAEALDSLTINVPRTASSGEQYAVIWAEVSTPPAPGGGVTLVNRVGVRVYLSIGPGGAPPSNFFVGTLVGERSSAGAPFVVATVHNNGQSTLDISGSLTLSKGPGGLGAGPFAAKLGAILAPGVSEPMTVRLDAVLPRGPWQADLMLTSGPLNRTAEAMITFPPDLGAARVPTSPTFLAKIVGAIVLLALLAITALAVPACRRRRWRWWLK